jgi:hypothetical protein
MSPLICLDVAIGRAFGHQQKRLLWTSICITTMAPTEESILRSFLLQKAGLRDVITLAEFSTYFPPSKRSSPLVRHLYRDIQSQRNTICEFVLKQINVECRFGENLVARKRAERQYSKTAGSAGTEDEIDINVLPTNIFPRVMHSEKVSCLEKQAREVQLEFKSYYQK